jgi:dTDP-4-amino-4,6-dideoxygalactose transaminase
MNSRIARLRIPFFETQAEMAGEAIRRGQLVYGPHLDELRTVLARQFGLRHVTLTTNGFSALLAALTAVGGDSPVLTAGASTCHAVTNAIRAARRGLELADIDPSCASLASVEGAALSVVPDHFGLVAQACRDWRGAGGCLIEDASQSFMSRALLPTQANIVTLSFYPTKLVNGIDGGALLTNDDTIHARAAKFVQYADQFQGEPEARFNLKMNNVNAAMTLATLTHLDAMRSRLLAVNAAYAAACRTAGIRYLGSRGTEVPSRFMVVADSPAAKAEWLARLERAGVQGASELMMLASPADADRFPNARALVDQSFSIPYHPLLEDLEVERVAQALAGT